MELVRGVRPMTGQDIEQMADLEQVCFPESWSENLVCMGLDNRPDTYSAYADHRTVLGHAVLWTLADEGEIQWVGVYPHYKRQGIARRLMGAMVTFVRARGVWAIAPEVRESNLGVRNLYDSYGFGREAVRKGYYHNPAEDAIIIWNRAI